MTYYENLIKHVHVAMNKHPRSPVVLAFSPVKSSTNAFVSAWSSALTKATFVTSLNMSMGLFPVIPDPPETVFTLSIPSLARHDQDGMGGHGQREGT